MVVIVVTLTEKYTIRNMRTMAHNTLMEYITLLKYTLIKLHEEAIVFWHFNLRYSAHIYFRYWQILIFVIIVIPTYHFCY